MLHITPWHPHPANIYEAIWIKRHIESIMPYVDQYVLHIQVVEGSHCQYQRTKKNWGAHITLRLPTKRWFFFEIGWFFVLISELLLFRKRLGKLDLILFHISYPALTYWHWLKRFIKTPVLIMEHWSAYHLNFGLETSDKLGRIKRIFSHRLPVVSVSRALLNDIKEFSGHSNFDSYILPNVVDTELFSFCAKKANEGPPELLMVGWSWPKKPDVLVTAFARWNMRHGHKYTLKIAGYGTHISKVEEIVQSLDLMKNVRLLGQLAPEQLAEEMKRSLFFAHCSFYETFSVVCAEALSCGIPVIASNVGGIAEFVHPDNGILVEENTVDKWEASLETMVGRQFDRPTIAREAQARFSSLEIGRQYFQIVKRVSSESD
jgi:L-malate glycosyltransferase